MPEDVLNGVRIAWERRGGGEPLLLLMGIGANLAMWPEGLLAALEARGFALVLVDARDTGRSERLDRLGRPRIPLLLAGAATRRTLRAPYALADMADDAAALLDRLGVRSAHVLGTSMGGMVAQELALRHPARVRSLTLLMTAPGARRRYRAEPRAARALFRAIPRERPEERLFETLRAIGSPGGRFDEEVARARARAAVARGLAGPSGFARHLSAVLASGDRTARLAAVRAPAVVLHGDADPLVPLAAGRDLAAALPAAEFVVVEGLGHELPRWAHGRIADAAARAAARARGQRPRAAPPVPPGA